MIFIYDHSRIIHTCIQFSHRHRHKTVIFSARHEQKHLIKSTTDEQNSLPEAQMIQCLAFVLLVIKSCSQGAKTPRSFLLLILVGLGSVLRGIVLLIGGDWNMDFMLFHILGIIIPIDFPIFQRDRVQTSKEA